MKRSHSLVVRTPLCGSGNPGSNPGVGTLSLCTVGLVGYDACFTRRRSRVRTSDCVWEQQSGRVAQMAERRSNKPSVVGSIPTVTTFCFWTGGRRTGKKVLPGFEPGSLDSKSRVLTNYTIRPLEVGLHRLLPSSGALMAQLAERSAVNR